MKALKSMLPVLAFVSLLSGCETIWDPPPKITESIIAEIPLNATFSTEFRESVIADGYIDMPGPVCQLVQVGSGSDDEIGFFSISLSCCWSASARAVGRSGGYLTDGEGNTLYIRCKENLSNSEMTDGFLSDHHVICGRYEFTGGTGRFEESSGEGTIKCTVISNGNTSMMSHHWQGTIKIRKSYVTGRPDY